MTTPTPPQFDASTAAGSRLLGVNALQGVVDKLTQAVDKMAAVAQSLASTGPAGTQTVGFRNTGQTFTFGSFPKMSSAAPSNGGPGGYGGSNVTQPSPMGQNGGMTPGQMAASTLSGGLSAMAPSGSQFSTQITMNQYAAMSSLGFGRGTNLGQGFRAMYNQAFGSYGSNLNAIATNATDAAQGYSTLQGIAASPYVNSTALGRAGYSAYAGLGISNPSLGAAGSAQAASQLYSGQTSMLMRMYGYGTTPRAMGGFGNPAQSAQVVQGLLQRWYGQGSVNQTTLNAGLAQNGRLQVNMRALGLDPNTYGPMIQMYNKLFQQGVSANQANAMLGAAAHNQNYDGTSAQKLLSNKYGIATSDLQKLKDSTAVGTSTTSGEMGSFDSALSGATTAVQKFDTAISKFLKDTGLGNIIGASHGFSGAMGSVGGTLGSLLGKGMSFGVGMLSKFGGAGGPTGPSGQGTPGSTSNNSMSRVVSTAIHDAESMIGRPYVWGGDNPSVGFDCSGLVEWAYAQAGIKLPRTSQEQWQYLKNRAVPMGKVQAGDVLFSAGSDGSPGNPGHEAMAISGSQIIEAPYTGADIRIRALNPGEWSHAARPNGSMTSGGGGTSGTNGNSPSSTSTGSGNAGLGLAVGSYGSSEEVSNIAAALLGGGMGGGGGTSMGSVGNGQGSGSSTGSMNVSTAGGGSPAANRALAQKMAAQMYGWTGSQWNALNSLWGTYESGFRANAQNPGSTAYGIAQFLNSTWGPYGPKTSNPGLQIKYGLEYVHDRYKDPIHALQFELSHTPHWYGDGTSSARRGLALVGERGPELVSLSGGQQVMNASKTADILKGQSARPGQTPWSAGTAAQLVLASVPQNSHSRAGVGKCEINLNLPPNAINIHTQGNATDVSNAVRQIMEGVSRAMAENETVRQIMDGVMG